MESYQEFINKNKRFLKQIPFVSQIYLCNSITFNKLHSWSDIDICIVTKPWYLRYARLRSWIYFFFLGIKRMTQWHNQSYKFCLSFYLDWSHTNLITLRKENGDIYLSYWLGHSVLLYTNHEYPDDYLFRTNKQLLSYLPNHPHTQTIFLDIPTMRWVSLSKHIIEYISMTRIGKIIQQLIKFMWWGVINRYKNKKLSIYQQQHIIISPTMLKFHNDKRTLYQQRRKSIQKRDY